MILKKTTTGNFKAQGSFQEALGLSSHTDGPCVITVVGAGGKTTLIETLAEELKLKGEHVLVVTTTHMEAHPRYRVLSGHMDDILTMRDSCGICYAGTPAGPQSMKWLGDTLYRALLPKFDYVLNEGDGAKRHPFKTPASYEPVLLDETDLVLVVAGMRAIDRPLSEACFRYELLGMPDHSVYWESTQEFQGYQTLTVPLAATILKNGYGHLPYPKFYILNQADSTSRIASAKEMAALLDPVLITSLLPS